MADPKSRARLQRLLRGDFRPGDLTELFIFARDHCDRRETITEIGAFVAHHGERDRGVTTKSTRAWSASARFCWACFYSDGSRKPLNEKKMPPATKDYFQTVISPMNAKYIREGTGLLLADADKQMQSMADRLVQNPDGTWALPTILTPTQMRLIDCVCSLMAIVKPALEATRLCDDFIATLKSNGLMTNDEVRHHKGSLCTLVQLFAVAAMHRRVIQIGDGETTQLKAQPALEKKQIWVNAPIPNAWPSWPGFIISSPMFIAQLDPATHCHPDLVAATDWVFEIELAPDRLLSRLG